MKTPRRSITFFSFFPVAVLLATPLMFSTLAPAETDDYIDPIDSSTWNVPQSQLVLEEFLRAQEVKNGEIEEVKFLQYDRDYIYRASGGDDDTATVDDDSRNAPTLTDSGEIDTTYTLNDPEFQRQVEDLSAQAEQAGAALPPLMTLVALFAFAVATGTSSLKEFFKFSTYTDKVKKTIQVTKKVAKTVYRTITETVARKVKTIKQVAYTAYETVKNVAYSTRTWVTEAVKHRPVTWHPIEQMEMKAKFLLDNINKYQGKFTRSYAKNVRYYTPNLSEYAYLKKEYDDVASGRKVGRYAQNVQHRVWNERQTLDHQAGQFFNGIADPKLREKLLSEYKSLNDVTYTEKTTHSETTPVVTYVEKPYTAYREEVETKTVYDTVTREVPETVYENVTEDREITEDVTKYSFTPLNEKIDIAMAYLKNYSRILQNSSNRNFSDSVLVPNRDLSLFAGAATVYNSLQAELKNANVYNMDRTDPESVKEILKRHNEFIYSMKSILTKIQKVQTPEEQMAFLFGKEYTDSIKATENAITSAEADEKALSARFEEIEELLRTDRISVGYYRSLYNSAKRNRDQLYRRKRDAVKNLKEGKEFYARKFNATISSLQNLSFLRSLEDWRSALAYGERSTTASRLVPFATANGSVIYRKPASPTTTQAQPKKILPKTQPVNLTTSNLGVRPADNADAIAAVTAAKVDLKPAQTPMGTTLTSTYVYLGPGSEYGNPIMSIQAGENLRIVGRLKENSWLKVAMPNGLEDGLKGWILPTAANFKANASWNQAPIITELPPIPPKPLTPKEFEEKTGIPYAIHQYGKVPVLDEATRDRLLKEAKVEAKKAVGKAGWFLSASEKEKIDALTTKLYQEKSLAAQIAIAATRSGMGLGFGDLSALPQNKKIIDFLLENYINNGAMQFNAETKEWVGKAYDNRELDAEGKQVIGKYNLNGQCKWWVDNIVVQMATGANLPRNHPDMYKWQAQENVQMLTQSVQSGTLASALEGNDVYPGDIVQYTGGEQGLHTMIIGQKTASGVWVFDSNYVEDLTPGYHFLSDATLNTVEKFTIYRVK